MSSWYRWDQRKSFEDMDKNGVYVIAEFGDTPSEPASHLSSEVIYIGISYGQKTCLSKRLEQFNRAAQNGTSNHAGGRSYYDPEHGRTFENVFFSVVPCALDDQVLNTARIYFLERKLIWEHASLHGELPPCNAE